jgi:hypothetical protein
LRENLFSPPKSPENCQSDCTLILLIKSVGQTIYVYHKSNKCEYFLAGNGGATPDAVFALPAARTGWSGVGPPPLFARQKYVSEIHQTGDAQLERLAQALTKRRMPPARDFHFNSIPVAG